MSERRTFTDRKNPLWFESDGDFNPGWFLFISFALLGALICVGALVALVLHPASWQLGVAALSFITFAMLCTAIIVVPIARAKLLTRLRGAVGDVASTASGGGSFFSASSFSAGSVPMGGEVLGKELLEPPTGPGRPDDE